MHASQRGQLLRKLGDLIARDAEALAAIEVQDNGKLISEMAGQLKYTPQWYYYYGGLADKIEGAVIPTDKDAFNYTRHEPLGVCAAITPWNSPILLFGLKVAPALAAGNTLVVKPSEYTSASTLALMKLFEEAGFPKGVINVVTGFGPEAGEPLVKHPLVRKIAFTGSSKTGAHVYSEAAHDIKRVSLELGGKSPNIVFDDCKMENAVKGVVSGIFAATGQTCIAGSRLLVQESIHNEFVDKLVDFARTARMGNPMDYDTQVGPVTNLMQYEKVLGYIDIAKSEGVETVLGGSKATRPECGDGWFVEPTVFTGVKNPLRWVRLRSSLSPPARKLSGRRQRRDLRPRRRCLDRGHAPRHHHVGTPPGGHRVGEHLSRIQLHDALRRLQAQRSGTGKRPGGHLRIHADQERVDLHLHRGAESFRDALSRPRVSF
jgi:aldehyde dehydrogenase (NAD+)